MSKTIVKGCKCPSKFQDATYGNGQRLMNVMGKGGDNPKARCTVCGTVH